VRVAAGSAGRRDDWRDTAPGQGCRNAGIDLGGRTNHTLGPRQLIAQIGAAGNFSLRGHSQAAGSRFATRVGRRRDRRWRGVVRLRRQEVLMRPWIIVGVDVMAAVTNASRCHRENGWRRRVVPQLSTACRAGLIGLSGDFARPSHTRHFRGRDRIRHQGTRQAGARWNRNCGQVVIGTPRSVEASKWLPPRRNIGTRLPPV
jgi:hypothetical protein